ncbi:MAG: hypothetical protein CFE22_16245 [Cytophagaceae bacterium BCCC1]|nr:MAG: hypothetical protein CFE22_17520 [Cytophagaceae bacterium BCCC1]OYU64934.1 MAG: hypothetical protein CFE22_16245 [Cytophagaceae bacterium BCCC1]
MTTSIFEKSMSVVTSQEGKPKALMFDITNKKVKEYFEDLLDTMEANERMNESSARSFNEFKEEYLASRKK